MSLIDNPRYDDAISPSETDIGEIVFMETISLIAEVMGQAIVPHNQHEFVLFQRVEFDQFDKSGELGEMVTPYNFKVLTGKQTGDLITLWKSENPEPEKVYNA